jgi:hypothetical protein
MGIGDSFRHPGPHRAVQTLMSRAKRMSGSKFTSRKEGTGYRIWRIA